MSSQRSFRSLSQKVPVLGRRNQNNSDISSSWSGPSTSSAGRIQADEFSRLVNDTVYYILIADQKKHSIKKAEIVKHVLKENSRSFNDVIVQVKSKLKEVFGYNLIEIKEKRGQYILVSTLDLQDADRFLKCSDDEYCKQGLVMVILALILMSDGVITETKFWNTLAKLGIKPDTNHSVFGNVKKFICTDLVKQLYLEYILCETTNPPTYEFQWGPRAIYEISLRKVLEFVCTMYGEGMQPQDWTSIYQRVLQSEQSQP